MKNVQALGQMLNMPETPEEKLQVLKDARAKLEQGFTQSKWCELIDGVHRYCIYGAIEAAMGFDFAQWAQEHLGEWGDTFEDFNESEQTEWFMQLDQKPSACSITNTLFSAVDPEANLWSKAVHAYENGGMDGLSKLPNNEKPYGIWRFNEKEVKSKLMDWKVQAIQCINDKEGGREVVLEVLDKAIADLETQL